MKKVFNWTVLGWLAFAFIIFQEFNPIKTQLDDIEAYLLGVSEAFISESSFRNEKLGGITKVPRTAGEVRKKISKPFDQQLSTLNSISETGHSEPRSKSIKTIQPDELGPSKNSDIQSTEKQVRASVNAKKDRSEKPDQNQRTSQKKNIYLIDLYLLIHEGK
mgnify:CR=1 FL=1